MAFKLNKEQRNRQAELVEQLKKERVKLESVLQVANSRIEEINEEVTSACEAYNAVLEQAREFAEEIGNDAENELGDKSERYQDSEKGEAAQEWVEAWQDLAENLSNDIEFAPIGELVDDNDQHDEMLDDAPTEAG